MHKKTLVATLAASMLLSTTVQADEIKQGGTLIVPIINNGFVENFNPYTTKDILNGTMFEPLMVHNNMTGDIDYRLAESYQYSDDLQTLTIKIRSGLTWSDGSPLTAEDIAYSYNMPKEAPAFDIKGFWGESGNLKSIDVIDDVTVQFNLKEPDSTFILHVSAYHIVPKAQWSKAKDLTTFTNPNPIGNGPFTEIKYQRAQQMELCRNPNYYLANENRPYIDCINLRSFSDNSQVQPALIRGEIDWGSNFIADIDRTYVDLDKENNHYWYPANDAIHLYVNTKEAPFDDVKVRQALSMALDRESIVEFAAYGYPTANYNVGGIAELYAPYIDHDLNKEYASLTQFNPEKANKLLDEAGLKDTNGDGVRETKDGKPFEFDIEVVNGWTDWIQVVQMVSEYYQEIGIKANVKTVDWSVYDENLKKSTYSMSINWSMVAADPILAFQEYYHTSRIGVTWHAGHGVHSPEVDEMIEAFGRTSDTEKQQAIIDDLQRFTAENVPFIPLFSNATWFQYSTKKFTGWPTAENPYVQPVFYDAGKRVIILNNLHLK